MARNDIPIGFEFTLSKDPDALERFSNLTEAEKTEIILQAKGAKSPKDVQALVNSIGRQVYNEDFS